MSTGALFFLIFAGSLGFCWLVIERRSVWRTLRQQRNRYRRGFLPAPASDCVGGDRWRAAAQQGNRY